MILHNVIALAGALTTYWDLYDRVALTLLATTLGIATSLHSPMRLAMVPLLVAREALPSAVGYSAMSFNIARMIGPALGAMLVAQVDTVAAWLTAMVLFSVSFWRLSLLTVELNRPVSAETSYLSQFMEGGATPDSASRSQIIAGVNSAEWLAWPHTHRAVTGTFWPDPEWRIVGVGYLGRHGGTRLGVGRAVGQSSGGRSRASAIAGVYGHCTVECDACDPAQFIRCRVVGNLGFVVECRDDGSGYGLPDIDPAEHAARLSGASHECLDYACHGCSRARSGGSGRGVLTDSGLTGYPR